MSSAAKRLAAPGVQLPGADGEPRTIRFDFAALARIEETLGSIGAAVDAIKRLIDASANAYDKAVMADLRALLDASVRPRVFDDVLEEIADVHLGTVIDAICDAWVQAWPPREAAADAGEAQAPPAARGRGRSSTTRRPSDSAAATTSSGG